MPHELLQTGHTIYGEKREAGWMVPDDCPNIAAMESIGMVGPWVPGKGGRALSDTPPPAAPARYLVVPIPGSSGWYHVVGPNGPVDDKKRRKKAADRLAAELTDAQ